MTGRFLFGAFAAFFSFGCFPAQSAQLNDVGHIIVIYLENHSFDNLFGFFANADGIASAGATKIQLDPDGHPYPFLPRVQRLVRKSDGTKEIFGTIGVSGNIIEASWQALVEAYEYHLLHVEEAGSVA